MNKILTTILTIIVIILLAILLWLQFFTWPNKIKRTNKILIDTVYYFAHHPIRFDHIIIKDSIIYRIPKGYIKVTDLPKPDETVGLEIGADQNWYSDSLEVDSSKVKINMLVEGRLVKDSINFWPREKIIYRSEIKVYNISDTIEVEKKKWIFYAGAGLGLNGNSQSLEFGFMTKKQFGAAFEYECFNKSNIFKGKFLFRFR